MKTDDIKNPDPDFSQYQQWNDHVIKMHDHCKCEFCTEYRITGVLPFEIPTNF